MGVQVSPTAFQEKINIEFLTKQLEKAQENIEKLKDADREIVYKNGGEH